MSTNLDPGSHPQVPFADKDISLTDFMQGMQSIPDMTVEEAEMLAERRFGEHPNRILADGREGVVVKKKDNYTPQLEAM